MEREKFVFYKGWYETIKQLPTTQQLSAFIALMEYGLYDAEVDNNNITIQAIVGMAKPLINTNKKRSEGGARGGRPKKEDNNETLVETIDKTIGETIGLFDSDIKETEKEKENSPLQSPYKEKEKEKEKVIGEGDSPSPPNKQKTTKSSIKKNDLNVPDEASEDYRAFIKWVQRVASHFFSSCEHIITQPEMEKLISVYGKEDFFEVFAEIENNKTRRGTYANMYLTVNNWLKGRYVKRQQEI